MLERLPAAVRRWLLGLALRARPGGSSDPSALLAQLPESTLAPLRREGVAPSAAMAALRDREPVSALRLPFGLRGWLVAGYDEARAVLADTASFSNDYAHVVGAVGAAPERDPGGLGMADAPDHTRLRRLLMPEFTSHRLARLTGRIDAIVDEQLDAMAAAADADGVVDLARHLAWPVPTRVITELLGVDPAEHTALAALSAARFDATAGAGGALAAVSVSVEALVPVVQRQRENPGDGLLGRLVVDHGDELTDRELAGLTDGLLTGGLETSAAMLALGTVVLLRSPGALAEVGASPERCAATVDELLRYLTVVQVAFPRFARADVTVGGRRIRAGDVVLVSLSLANRDPRIAGQSSPVDDLDPRRAMPAHLAFGYGVHRCVGAELARLELRSAYSRLARRFPDLTLAVPESELEYRPLSLVFGVESVPVRLAPVAP
ncbi:cytochrome P450 [Cellulomonas sp. P5_E12]